MTASRFVTIALALSIGACAQQSTDNFIPSRKPATELRAMQVRVIDAEPDTAMRGVIATLHDLGYRITRADAETGTVSATRQTSLRMAVVVQPRPPRQSIVRANATLIRLGREAQVDSPEFYAANFFRPLGDTLQRNLALLGEGDVVPDPARPLAERLTSRLVPATGASSPSAPAPLGTSSSAPAQQEPIR